jgi:ATP-binding cassette subfamily B protein
MRKSRSHTTPQKEVVERSQPNLFGLLPKYKGILGILVLVTVIANALSLSIPKIISSAIDTYTNGDFVLSYTLIEFSIIAILICIFTFLQNIVQVYASEQVARDLRNNIIEKISNQTYTYIESVTPAKILTNLTSDVDAVKTFISTAISSLISSGFLIIGTSILLIYINWRLGLTVLTVVPIIGFTFFFVLRKVRKLFTISQEAIDSLNRVISESILGAALIRLLNSEQNEYVKFLSVNTEAKTVSLKILNLFASLIPAITFFTNMATLVIILLGGKFVTTGSMSLGDFTAFNSYLAILIFPILIIGFMSNLLAQAQASYSRIIKTTDTPTEEVLGNLQETLNGNVEAKHITLELGGKSVLRDISFSIQEGTKTAIIGPTAAGKTQLLYILTGLLEPTSGSILFDGKELRAYDKKSLHSQIGFVFQDSIMFNLSVRENIAFSNIINDKNIELAIQTAELSDYIKALPNGLDTLISERGTSMSGGQKQRIMLARALALNPKILFLDDFTARVDTNTEQKILQNITKNYPDITLVSVTQKISSIEHYNQIILMVEGEILAQGIHEDLIHSSPEYAQIYQSQRSTNEYEKSK